MAFQPVTNGWQVLLNFRQAGQELQNQMYVTKPSGGAEVGLFDVAQAFGDWVGNSWATVASETAILNSIIVTDVTVEAGAQVTFVPIGTLSGDLSVPPLPTGTTITASWRTGLSGRSYRGRTYHIGLVEDQVNGNELAEARRTQIVAAYSTLIADLITLGAPLAVCSRFTNNAPRAAGILTPINVVIVEPYIDSQRRRLTGRGR